MHESGNAADPCTFSSTGGTSWKSYSYGAYSRPVYIQDPVLPVKVMLPLSLLRYLRLWHVSVFGFALAPPVHCNMTRMHSGHRQVSHQCQPSAVHKNDEQKNTARNAFNSVAQMLYVFVGMLNISLYVLYISISFLEYNKKIRH